MKNLNYNEFSCEFDIENEAVFSIERQPETRFLGKLIKPAQTVISFYSSANNELTTWEVICSEGQHRDFVSRFRRKLKLPPYGNTGIS
jgi:hypothetical protein